MLKNQNGITLVALVITIIILIILATVTINFAFEKNGLTVTIIFAFNGGIVDRANQAKNMYANDTKYTDDSLANVVAYIYGRLPDDARLPAATN